MSKTKNSVFITDGIFFFNYAQRFFLRTMEQHLLMLPPTGIFESLQVFVEMRLERQIRKHLQGRFALNQLLPSKGQFQIGSERKWWEKKVHLQHIHIQYVMRIDKQTI